MIISSSVSSTVLQQRQRDEIHATSTAQREQLPRQKTIKNIDDENARR